MAKIPVKFQKLFGGALLAANNIARYGSLAAGAPAYSLDPDDIQSLAAWVNGWAAALINAPGGNASPALQDFNAAFYVLTYQLAYLKQAGLAEWDPAVTYYIGSWAQDGLGVPYKCIQDNNLNHALTDTNWWVPLKDTLVQGAAQMKAWVCFNGTNGAIYSGFNVASVARTAAGCYILNFTNPMTDALYGFSGSCGTPAGQPWSAGDDNVVVGGVSGRVMVKSQTQLSVFAWDRGDGSPQDSKAISVQVFGN